MGTDWRQALQNLAVEMMWQFVALATLVRYDKYLNSSWTVVASARHAVGFLDCPDFMLTSAKGTLPHTISTAHQHKSF